MVRDETWSVLDLSFHIAKRYNRIHNLYSGHHLLRAAPQERPDGCCNHLFRGAGVEARGSSGCRTFGPLHSKVCCGILHATGYKFG